MRIAALLTTLALVGCKTEDPKPDETTSAVSWDESADALTLRREDKTLLTIPLAGFSVAVTDAYNDLRSYDPFWDDYTVTWLTARSASVSEATEDKLVVDLAFDQGLHATLTAHELADGRWDATLVPNDKALVAYFKLGASVSPTERFYGLGTVLDTPDHRGKRRGMQTELDVEVESGYNEAHVPIPLLIGTQGWGLFVEDQHPMVWDVATAAADQVDMTVGTGKASATGLHFHLYTAEHPIDITAHYWADTGAPKKPAPWALGPLVWRDENKDQAEFEDDLDTMRDLDLAASGVWIDRPYASGIQTFDFNPVTFPDPDAAIAHAHASGYRVALWHAPYLSETESPTLYAEALDKGYFPELIPPVFNNWGPAIDFTSPDAMAFWTAQVRKYTDRGIEGFKLDYGEDVVVGVTGGRVPWLFRDGSDERTMHAQYQALYHQAYSDALPEDNFLLVRAGTYGDQKVASVIWPGDLDADLLAYKEPAVDRNGDSYIAVGGLEASLVDALSLGPSGYPFYGSDTGGYRQSPPDKETLTRWFEQTALSTVMQIGNSSNDMAWEPTDINGFDADMLDWYRDYTRLHQRLFPYLWTYANQLATGGRPIMRPIGLAFPELESEPGDTYMLGDALLVAPVMRRDARTREITFPVGTWVNWFDGTVLDGDQTVTVEAPLESLPLYLAAGGIVPLLRPTIDTVSPVDDPEVVDSYATDPGVLWVRLTPGPASEFTVFDASWIEQEQTDGAVTLSWTAGTKFTKGAMIESIATPRPTTVTLDDATPLAEAADQDALPVTGGWSWSADAGGTLSIRIPAGDHSVRVE